MGFDPSWPSHLAGEKFLCWGTNRSNSNQLLIHEFLDAHTGKFASIPGIFDASERKVRSGPSRVIDKYHACVNPTRQPLAALNVLGED